MTNRKPTYEELSDKVKELQKDNSLLRKMFLQHQGPKRKFSEFKYKSIADFYYDCEIYLGCDRKIEYVSPSCKRITGYGASEFFENENLITEIVHPDDKKIFENHIHEVDEDGFVQPIQYRIITKKGETKWITHICQEIYDGKGKCIGIRAINRDITEHKITEAQLKESELRFRSIFEQDRTIKLVIDPKTGMIEDANQSAIDFYGYSKKTLLSKNISDINILSDKEIMAEMEDAVALRKNYFDFKHKLASGEIRDVHVYSSPIKYKNNSKLLSIIHDVTLQKEAEKSLIESRQAIQTVLDNIPMAVFAHAGDGHIMLVNDTSELYTGYTKEELLKMRMCEVDPNVNDRDDKGIIWDKLKIGENIKIQAHHKTKTGSTYPVEVTITAMELFGNKMILGIAQDITERLKAESVIKERESKYRILAENMIDLVAQHEPDGTYTYISPSVLNLLGYAPEELIGTNPYELFHPDDLEHIKKESHEAALKGKDVTNIEYRIRKKNGDYIWFLTHTKPIFNDKKELVQLQTHSQDITERVKAENEIKESEAKYRMLADNMVDLVVQHNLEGELTYVSPSSYNLWGYRSEELLGKKIYKIFHPDETAKVRNVFNEMVNSWGVEINSEFRIKHKDGMVVWVSASTKSITNRENEVVKLQTHFKDITERVYSEKKLNESLIYLKLAQEIAKIGNWQFDPMEGKPTWSDEIFRIYERDPELGTPEIKDYQDIFDKVNYEKFHQAFSDALKNGQPYSLKLELGIPNGGKKYIRTICKPVYKTAKGYFLRGTIQDITEQQKKQIELIKREEELEELNHTKDKLFSIISHDLKSPLGSIIGFSELIEHNFDKYSTDKIKRFNNLIYTSSKSISEILENLLTWSRSQRNKLLYEPDNLNVAYIIEKVINLEEGTAERKHISIINKVPVNQKVYADDKMLMAILRNLVSNAIKFSHENGEIILSSSKTGNKLKISVKDSGVGVEKERAKRMFKIVDNSSTKGTAGEEGTGLGLTICKEFVERHGGKIWMESEPDKGATFHFTIPLTAD
ncbi:MAG: hypothetical protein C0599_14500 [Salinivirgaceae bacterium]|nr:MAG: hypothetical protein C0599_14500 [Salinivirgaceae bacterium]